MSQNEESKEDLQDASRREALAKLAKMTAYSTPAVVTLLTPQLSHAQASLAPGNPACEPGGSHRPDGVNTNANNNFLGNLFGDWFSGSADFGSGYYTDTEQDCG